MTTTETMNPDVLVEPTCVVKRRSRTLPAAVVFDCKGAAEGALNVVRTLGRAGVPVTVVADSSTALSRRSRFCTQFVHLPNLTRDSEATVHFLVRHAAQQPEPPVLFPTSDPDLLLVSAYRDTLQKHFRLFVASRDLIDSLTDKRRFSGFAARHGFPVPQTHAPTSREDVIAIAAAIRYPVVVKPSHPAAWTSTRLQEIVGNRKALILGSASELLRAYDSIAPHSAGLLVQEWIVGPDDAHYSMHAYFTTRSEPAAVFTGRKIRLYPAHAGSGCYVESLYIPSMIARGVEILRKIGYTGVAVLNFKQDMRTGEFMLHEINPRISQWNILATQSGVNIPLLAYAEAAGLEVRFPGRQIDGVHYVHLRNDLKSVPDYRRCGEWTMWRYPRSLLARPMVYQDFAADDWSPFWASTLQALRCRLLPVPSRNRGGTPLVP